MYFMVIIEKDKILPEYKSGRIISVLIVPAYHS